MSGNREVFHRGVRIEGKPNDMIGIQMNVRDTDGNVIRGITHVEITLDVHDVNQARITYCDLDDQGHIMLSDECEPITHEVVVQDPEVALTAMESSRVTLGPYELRCIVGERGFSMQVEDQAHHRWELIPEEVVALFFHLKAHLTMWQKWVEAHAEPNDAKGGQP